MLANRLLLPPSEGLLGAALTGGRLHGYGSNFLPETVPSSVLGR